MFQVHRNQNSLSDILRDLGFQEATTRDFTIEESQTWTANKRDKEAKISWSTSLAAWNTVYISDQLQPLCCNQVPILLSVFKTEEEIENTRQQREGSRSTWVILIGSWFLWDNHKALLFVVQKISQGWRTWSNNNNFRRGWRTAIAGFNCEDEFWESDEEKALSIS